jgi:hypothetical protein
MGGFLISLAGHQTQTKQGDRSPMKSASHSHPRLFLPKEFAILKKYYSTVDRTGIYDFGPRSNARVEFKRFV